VYGGGYGVPNAATGAAANQQQGAAQVVNAPSKPQNEIDP
jgi:hypothetical protein